MEYYYLIIFFIFGAVLGSFYQVIGERLPKNESIISPKYSYCPNCKRRLKWYELIPIFSYIIQLGKCRGCKKEISIMYPFIEIITGALFAVSYYSFGFSYELIISLTLVSYFSIVIVSDITYMIIPDEVTILASLIIILTNFVGIGLGKGLIQLGSGVLAFGIMYSIMLIGNAIFKKETLGGADIKLMFIAGLVLHPILAVIVIFVASCIALPVSLIIYLMNREHMIPFGPFLVAAIILLFFMKIDVDTFINLFRFI